MIQEEEDGSSMSLLRERELHYEVNEWMNDETTENRRKFEVCNERLDDADGVEAAAAPESVTSLFPH